MNPYSFLKRGSLALTFLLLCVSCQPKPQEDRSSLQCAQIQRPAQSGWARVRLSREAQQGFDTLWLGDDKGQCVPTLLEQDGLWSNQELEKSSLLLGRDQKGRPTAEFTLALPEGWQIQDREHLNLALDLEGQAPWVAQVEIERKLPGSPSIVMERKTPIHVFDLEGSGSRSDIVIPWDAFHHRITLIPVQGQAPRIKGVTVTATSQPSLRREDALESAQITQEGNGSWLLSLQTSGADRIIGADLALRAPVAPVMARFALPLKVTEKGASSDFQPTERPLASSGMLWNLPALQTESRRISLEPTFTDQVRVHLPEGVHLESAQLMVRRDVLLFPAEAGHSYRLHWGGQSRQAPGELSALPHSSRQLYHESPLALSPAQPDPHGLPLQRQASDPLKAWLPWIAGIAVLIMGSIAFKLLRGHPTKNME